MSEVFVEEYEPTIEEIFNAAFGKEIKPLFTGKYGGKNIFKGIFKKVQLFGFQFGYLLRDFKNNFKWGGAYALT